MSPKYQCRFYWYNNHTLNYYSFKIKRQHMVIKVGIPFVFWKEIWLATDPNNTRHCVFGDLAWALRLRKNDLTTKIIIFIRKATIIANQGAIQVTPMQGWLKHHFSIFLIYCLWCICAIRLVQQPLANIYFSCYIPDILRRVVDLEMKHFASSLKNNWSFMNRKLHK